MAPSKKFKQKELKTGKARVSMLNIFGGLDPVVPVKGKKNKLERTKRGCFPSSSKTRNVDTAYEGDESSGGEDSDFLTTKKDGNGILKGAKNAPNSVPRKIITRKAGRRPLIEQGDSDAGDDDSYDSSDITDSISDSEIPLMERSKKLVPVDSEGETSEITAEAVTTDADTTEGDTTDAEPGPSTKEPQTDESTSDAHASGTSAPPVTPVDDEVQTAHDIFGADFVMVNTVQDPEPGQPALAVQETPASPSGATSTAPADPNWSPSQDAILTAMKEGNEPWKAIASALGKAKKDVVARWKILQKNKAADADAAAPAAPDSSADPFTSPAHGPSVNPVVMGGPPQTSLPDATVMTTTAPFTVPAPASPVQGPPSSRNQSASAKGKGRALSPLLEEESNDEEDYINNHMLRSIMLEEENEQMLRRLYSAYEDRVTDHIRPDEFFSPLDCRVLGLLKAKRNQEQWLEMQAAFFNVTGRMVPIEMLQDRMGGVL